MKRIVFILALAMMVVLGGCGQEEVKESKEVSAPVEAETADIVEGKDEKTEKEEAEEDAETEKKAETEAKKDGEEKEEAEEETIEETIEETTDNDAAESVESENESESDQEEEEQQLPEYTVTAFDETMVMYAANPVNVRKGPSTDFKRVGGLGRGQEVTVTGQADTEWYEIAYGGDKAYVSNHYLQNDKPVEEPAPQQEDQTQEAANPQPVTEVKNVAGVILVGDSRFVQMQENVGENSCIWIAENGKGYNWLNENAMARIDGCVGKGSKILINLGVNDTGNLQNYLTLVNAKAAEWVGKGAKVYYASVNPVWENPYVTEEQVEYFNSQMQNGLSGDVRWIDSHSYLNSIGYKLVDGLHYNAETYQNLYAYFMSCL